MENVEKAQSDSLTGPVFVVGMWRSGTSLLYALLNKHPRIRLMYEGELPLLWPIFLAPGGKSNWLDKWDSWNQAIERHQIDVHRIPPQMADLETAFLTVCTEYARQKGATLWGCKSPNYYDRMSKLARKFPAAKFIVIWRDPADVCRSVVRASKNSPWFARKGMGRRALLGFIELKRELEWLHQEHIPVHQLHYQELTGDTGQAMKKICEFLAIPYDDGMTSLDGADRSAIYADEHHSLVKSEQVVLKSEGSGEVLTAEFKSKIERYKCLWKKRYGATWPIFSASENELVEPSFWEQQRDRAVYRLLRLFDGAVPVLYCFVPLRVWKGYRVFKRRVQLSFP